MLHPAYKPPPALYTKAKVAKGGAYLRDTMVLRSTDFGVVSFREFRLFLTPRKELFHNHVSVRVIRGGVAHTHPIHYDHFFQGSVSGMFTVCHWVCNWFP